MSDFSLRDWVRVNQFTPGRAVFATHEIERAAEGDLPPLVRARLDSLRAAATTALARQKQWDETPDADDKPLQPSVADRRVDATIKAIHGFLQTAATALPSTHELPPVARRILNRHFPEGHTSITGLLYVDELASAKLLHEELSAADLAPAMAMLGVAPFLALLGDQLVDYQAALAQKAGPPVTWDAVRAAHATMNDEVSELVSAIAAATYGQPAQRATLMAPIVRQHEEISAGWSTRRKVRDVDPNTGVEIVEPEAPSEPGPAEPVPA